MGHLRALSRMPVQVSVYSAFFLAASLLVPVAAGASTSSHPSKGPAPAAVGAVRQAYVGGVTRAQKGVAMAGHHRARQGSARPSAQAAQPSFPSGLDLLLGHRVGSGPAGPL